MLTRRAKAYSSSCSQTVSLSPTISSQFIFGVCAAAKDCKNQQKPFISKVLGFSVIDVDTTVKLVAIALAVICSMPMMICNRFHQKTGQQRLLRGYRSLMPSCAGFLEPRKSRLIQLKSTFNAGKFICSFLCLSQLASAQFALELCLAARNRQKIIKPLF